MARKHFDEEKERGPVSSKCRASHPSGTLQLTNFPICDCHSNSVMGEGAGIMLCFYGNERDPSIA